jgi:hypothetical protein
LAPVFFAPLAIADEDSPSIVNFRDTTIENQYMEIKRLTKPFENNNNQYKSMQAQNKTQKNYHQERK